MSMMSSLGGREIVESKQASKLEFAGEWFECEVAEWVASQGCLVCSPVGGQMQRGQSKKGCRRRGRSIVWRERVPWQACRGGRESGKSSQTATVSWDGTSRRQAARLAALGAPKVSGCRPMFCL